MNSDAADPLHAPAPVSPLSGDTTAAERHQVVRLAQEFEALLMTQMLREMRRSMVSDDEQRGLGAAPLSDTADVEFGRALSRAGGVGLADVVLRAFERQLAGTPAARGGPPATGAEGGAPAATLRGSMPAASGPATAPSGAIGDLPAPRPGPVNSPYG